MTAKHSTSRCAGVTLIELAIVIAIIALIIGGIVVGQSLIRNAQIREVIGEYDRYQKAVQEFMDKYNQLPGDFMSATSYWGTDSNGCPNGTAGSAAQRGTCNGNGNGRVGDSLGAGSMLPDNTEWFRAWQHMANAGLIEGIYSGTPGTVGSSQAVPDTNIPGSKIPRGGWLLLYYRQDVTSNSLYAGPYGHIFIFGAMSTTDAPNYQPVITPTEALEWDTKMDDGKPGMGNMRAWRSVTLHNPNCIDSTTDSSPTNAQYKKSYTDGMACSPIIILGF